MNMPFDPSRRIFLRGASAAGSNLASLAATLRGAYQNPASRKTP